MLLSLFVCLFLLFFCSLVFSFHLESKKSLHVLSQLYTHLNQLRKVNCNKIGAYIYVGVTQCFDRPLMSLKVVMFSMSMLRNTNWPSVMTDPTLKFTKKMEMRG